MKKKFTKADVVEAAQELRLINNSFVPVWQAGARDCGCVVGHLIRRATGENWNTQRGAAHIRELGKALTLKGPYQNVFIKAMSDMLELAAIGSPQFAFLTDCEREKLLAWINNNIPDEFEVEWPDLPQAHDS